MTEIQLFKFHYGPKCEVALIEATSEFNYYC